MATEIYDAPLGELRAILGSVGGGLALTTTAKFLPLPKGSQHLFLTPRNFVTGVVAQILVNPWLVILKTTDNLATSAAATEYSDEAQDDSATTEVVLDALDTAANLDFLYIGSHLPFRGVSVDMSADAGEVNGNASVLTVKYRTTGGAWTAVSGLSDGTAAAGATFAQDGLVSWTVPTDWDRKSLRDIGSAPAGIPHHDLPLYWSRWEVSLALDASVRADAMLAAGRSTSRFELLSGQTLVQRIRRNPGGKGSIEALMDAGTGNLLANVAGGESGFGE